MKNSAFDKKIKDLIDGQGQADGADVSASKDRIWESLEINSPKVFPFWKAAAGLLFLALIGILLFTMDFANREKAQTVELKNKIAELEKVIQRTTTTESNIPRVETDSISDTKTPTNVSAPKVIEKASKTIYVRDTILLEQRIVDTLTVERIDTIYLPAQPSEVATGLAESKIPNDEIERKKRPSRVEFIFATTSEKTAMKQKATKSTYIVSPFSPRTTDPPERNDGSFTVINLTRSKK